MKSRFIFLTFLLVQTEFALASDLALALTSIKDNYEIPGLAAAFYRDGKEIETAVSGIRKIGHPNLIEKNDKFHLASCSKAMTATLVATFIEEGKLSWESKLTDLLPDIEIHEKLKNVTFEMLLAHRAGLITDPEDDLYFELSELEIVTARKKLAEIILNQEPIAEPGTFKYSNVGYIIAGHILEKLTGRSWEMLMNERIFSSLKMSSCGFGPISDPQAEQPMQPWGHRLVDGKFSPIHTDNALFYGPSASVNCSLKDWSKFIQVHIDGYNGIKSILTTESFNKLHTAYPDENESYTYGGWIVVNQPWSKGPLFTHSGSNTINYATVWFAPAEKAILISTTNVGIKSGRPATNDAIVTLIKQFMINQ